MALVLFASAVLAFVLPPVYRSTATILIEEELVAQELVASSAAGYAGQRIQRITQRLMTYDNLRQIVELLNRDPEKDAELIRGLRKNIEITTVSAEVTDPRRNKSGAATIAFTISFDADSPEFAYQVTNELVTVYLDENLKIRTKKTKVTSDFLAEQESRLAKNIAKIEARLATHKEQNVGRLPELMRLNLQLMERTEKELEGTERQIYNLEERNMYLQAQLAQLEPYTGQSPAVRLRELQTQYLNAAAIYAPSHPDVIGLRRQIELLKQEVGAIDETAAIGEELKKVRAELDSRRQKYAENHPDIIRLKKSLRSLEEALQEAMASTQLGFSLKPDNPAYISIQTQLDAVKLNLKATREQRLRAKEKLDEYERRLTETPRVEQKGLTLTREYENAVREHREIKEKLMRANLAVDLERKQGAQRYSLLEEPKYPHSPVKPNRRAILLLGVMLAIGSGVGYASLAEYMDRTLHGPEAISALLGAPPLAVIPYIPGKKSGHEQRQVVRKA
jgi:uncharacterized protein involved in exopolysaccharide biosynthesis